MATKTKPKRSSKKPEEKKISAFQQNLKRFIDDIDGIDKSLISVVIMQHLWKKENEKVREFIRSKTKVVKDTKTLTTYIVPPENRAEHDKLKRERNRSYSAYSNLPRSLFVSMVTQFDVYFSELIKIVLDLQNNILSPDKPVTLRELRQFERVSDVIGYLIEKEISGRTHDSRSDQITWIGDRTGIDTAKIFKDEMPYFVEIGERRNLFAHCDGLIDEGYLAKCKSVGFVQGKSIKKGVRLSAEPAYFESSSQTLQLIAIKLSLTLWRKLSAENIEDSSVFFNNEIVVELIKQKRYALVFDLLEFSLTNFNFTNTEDVMRRILTINKALVLKLTGKLDQAYELLQKEDWSSCVTDFQLAIFAIKDDYESCYKIMLKIGPEGELVSQEGYHNDPIFSNLRKQPKFAKIYKRIYKKDFAIEVEETPTKK